MHIKEFPEISVVVPVFNSQESLETLHTRIVRSLNNIGLSYELIFVNDGSFIDVWHVLQKIASKDKNVKCIELAKNYGQVVATLCGLKAARGSIVITLDDDLQHPPEEISKLLDALTDNYDVVLGIPEIRKYSWFKNLGSKVLYIVGIVFLGTPRELRFSSFRAMRISVVSAINKMTPVNPSMRGMIYQATDRIRNVYVSHEVRRFGSSTYSWAKLFSLAVDTLVSPSTKVLKILGTSSLVGALVSLTFTTILIFRYLIYGSAVAGWLSITLLLLFLTSINLMSISFLGFFIVKIFGTLSNPNLFVVRRTIPEKYESFETNKNKLKYS